MILSGVGKSGLPTLAGFPQSRQLALAIAIAGRDRLDGWGILYALVQGQVLTDDVSNGVP